MTPAEKIDRSAKIHQFKNVLAVIAWAEAGHDYAARNGAIYQALALATELGYEAGIRFDPDPESGGPGWPVVMIGLPNFGQVSWHVPAFAAGWDGHDVGEKYARCFEYCLYAEEEGPAWPDVGAMWWLKQ